MPIFRKKMSWRWCFDVWTSGCYYWRDTCFISLKISASSKLIQGKSGLLHKGMRLLPRTEKHINAPGIIFILEIGRSSPPDSESDRQGLNIFETFVEMILKCFILKMQGRRIYSSCKRDQCIGCYQINLIIKILEGQPD